MHSNADFQKQIYTKPIEIIAAEISVLAYCSFAVCRWPPLNTRTTRRWMTDKFHASHQLLYGDLYMLFGLAGMHQSSQESNSI